MIRILIISVFLILSSTSFSIDKDSVRFLDHSKELNNKRVIGVSSAIGAAYLGSNIGLYQLWYKDHSSGNFHFFNDIPEWQGMDKVGHVFSAYYINAGVDEFYQWSGVKPKNSRWIGAGISFAFMTTIELMDGVSSGWGFSWGDMAANTIGIGLYIGQDALWGERRIVPKFSFHSTRYSKERPSLLGQSFIENIMKDYNGQTYWLSVNVYDFLKKDSKFPKWLNFAVGYSATGMTGGTENPLVNNNNEPIGQYERYGQFLFSIDIDLRKIKTKSKFLNGLFKLINVIKIPAPTIEIRTNGLVKGHWVYF